MAVDLGYVFIIGFASTRLTELWKEIMLRVGLHQLAWWKGLINILCCASLVLLVQDRAASTRILIALGASGLAMLFHATDTVLRHYRDELISEVLKRVGRVLRRR